MDVAPDNIWVFASDAFRIPARPRVPQNCISLVKEGLLIAVRRSVLASILTAVVLSTQDHPLPLLDASSQAEGCFTREFA